MQLTRSSLVELIHSRLTSQLDELKAAFSTSKSVVGVRHCVIDDLLPTEIAHRIADAFPSTDKMRLMNSFREKKFTSKKFDQFDPILGDVTFAIQDPRIVSTVEKITGIKEQIPDSKLYAGGLSAMTKGHFLSAHIDNSHDATRNFYRTLNLLYYVTPDWEAEYGGNLELWNSKVDRSVCIHSKFNRLVLMETNPWSWHSVNKVTVDGPRSCVSNYYFSPQSPTDRDYFNITAFSAPPNQPVLRLLSKADAVLRQFTRTLKPSGLGKLDIYDGPPR